MLLLHILATTITLLICAFAWFRPTQQLRSALGIFTTLSLLSGGFLALEPRVLTRAFCLKLGVYLLMIVATYLHLHFTARLTDA